MKKVNKEIKKQFANIYRFCISKINKFFLMLQNGAHPFEYMNDWKKVSEALLPKKEKLFSYVNIEAITVENC